MAVNSQVSRDVRIGPLLIVLSGAPFLSSLDLFVVNVAFGDISASFPDHSLGDLSWVLNGYTIVFAALLVPLGRWSDRIGRRRGFLLGLALFTAASAACALSPSLWFLIAFRLLQAFGAAALTPASLGLLISTAPKAKHSAAVRIWAATGAAAAALGPVVGGLLVEASWRWVFLINVPVGIALLVATFRVVPDVTPTTTDAHPDLLGAALLTIGIGALSLGLVQGPEWGWDDTRITIAFVVGAVSTVLFGWRNARHRNPLIEPAVLKVPTFAWSNVTAVAFSAAFAAGLLANILWLQQVWGYSALRTGLAIAPGPLMVPVFAILGQNLSRRVSAGLLAAAGSILWAVGTLLILRSVGEQPHYTAALLPGLLIGGVGVGLTLPTILSSATAGLPQSRSATGSAVVNMSRQIGTVLGVSVLVAILGTAVGYEDTHSAYQLAWWAVTAAAVVAAITAVGMNSRTPSREEAKVRS